MTEAQLQIYVVLENEPEKFLEMPLTNDVLVAAEHAFGSGGTGQALFLNDYDIPTILLKRLRQIAEILP